MLRERGHDVEVVNASVPGYTTHQERVLLDRIAAAVEPDLITVQYCLNDNHRFLHRLTEDGGWLLTHEARAALRPDGDRWIARLSRWSYLAMEVRRAWLGLSQTAGGDFPWADDPAFGAAWREASWPPLEAELGAIQARAAELGAPLLVLAVPYEPQLRDRALTRDRAYALLPQTRLAELCHRRGIALLDLVPCFLGHRGESLFVDGIHLSPAGHRRVVEELAARLVSDGLVR